MALLLVLQHHELDAVGGPCRDKGDVRSWEGAKLFARQWQLAQMCDAGCTGSAVFSAADRSIKVSASSLLPCRVMATHVTLCGKILSTLCRKCVWKSVSNAWCVLQTTSFAAFLTRCC